MGFNK